MVTSLRAMATIAPSDSRVCQPAEESGQRAGMSCDVLTRLGQQPTSLAVSSGGDAAVVAQGRQQSNRHDVAYAGKRHQEPDARLVTGTGDRCSSSAASSFSTPLNKLPQLTVENQSFHWRQVNSFEPCQTGLAPQELASGWASSRPSKY
jgi:hypothetical protein